MWGKVDTPGRTGFTLIEALVVVAIVAVLFSIAVPSYQRYVQRGQRADAIRAMLEISACQERVRARGGVYDTTRCAGHSETAAYSLSLEPADQSATLKYTVVASPKKKGLHDLCGDLYLDNAGTRRISGEARHTTACWSGK